MMTRQHFVLLARTIAELRPSDNASRDARVQWCETVRHFNRVLATQNPRFDLEKFTDACGLNEANNVRP